MRVLKVTGQRLTDENGTVLLETGSCVKGSPEWFERQRLLAETDQALMAANGPVDRTPHQPTCSPVAILAVGILIGSGIASLIALALFHFS